MAEFVPSHYQSAIFEAVKSGNDNLIVQAVAGSGKSKSLEESIKVCDRSDSVIALAFNKSIATELSRRVPDGVEATTLNSLGHRTFIRSQPRKTKVGVDGRKLWQIARDVIPYDSRNEVADVVGLVSKAKIHGLVPENVKSVVAVEGLMADTDDNWLQLASTYGIDLPFNYARSLAWARNILGRSVTQTAIIDFDDQLYMPIIYGMSFPQYDRIFVDECQDLSGIQMEMISRLGDDDSRYLLVGDRMQALYQFRGADAAAMDRMKERFNAQELPLSICYRCDDDIVKFAQQYVPQIEAAPGAKPGTVADRGLAANATYEPGDMVLCRTNRPLVALAYDLLGRGVRVQIAGRDIAKGLKTIIKKLNAHNVESLLKELKTWEQKQVTKFSAAGEEHRIANVVDQADVIRIIADGSSANSVKGVELAIDDLFDEKRGPRVLFSTIHKAKGLEAERVHIINHHDTPKWSDAHTETCCKYVAATRAKHEMYFVLSPSPERG